MRPDVHAAALRSAAKLVLGMASIASFTVACAAQSDNTESGSEAVTANNNGGDDTTTNNSGDDDDATNPDAGVSSECHALLKSTFPGTDKYQYKPVKEPADVVACCDEALAAGIMADGHRWACCVAYDKVDSHGNPEPVSRKHGMACTPWGPPVPPRMNRARKPSRARQDMNAALVALVA